MSKAKPRPLPLKRTTRSLLIQLQLLRSDLEDGDNDFADDIDVHVGYRRPDVVTKPKVDNNSELDDYVKFRLWLARQLALKKFNEVYQQKQETA
jgi:hypothetical protein